MNKRNYQKELERILEQLEKQMATGGADNGSESVPTLFLHSCCAPCSSYVLKYLRTYFAITVFYYNPNISEQEEYGKRVEEQKRLIAVYNETAGRDGAHPIKIVEGDYAPEEFFKVAAPYKDCPEGGERCFLCYELRLRRAAELAAGGGYNYFGTTLTISPLKNAEKLNEIGFLLAEEFGVRWLPSDFKKKEGYKQSIELSARYGLYRQDYCGCAYSKAERERQKQGR